MVFLTYIGHSWLHLAIPVIFFIIIQTLLQPLGIVDIEYDHDFMGLWVRHIHHDNIFLTVQHIRAGGHGIIYTLLDWRNCSLFRVQSYDNLFPYILLGFKYLLYDWLLNVFVAL